MKKIPPPEIFKTYEHFSVIFNINIIIIIIIKFN